MTITNPSTVVGGSYPLTITGTSGTLVRTTAMTLTVFQHPDHHRDGGSNAGNLHDYD
jgi:hypothetical protein